ncbi:MAG: hypothetical protein AAB459_03270, partial [Patescibacteria group bacterium]
MFLAVSGALFVIAMGFISGRQNQAYFTSSLREFQQQIEDLINDVTTGYYPTGSFTCQYDPSPGNPESANGISFSSVAAEQGTRDQCTFIGKVIHFDLTNKKFTAISVAGGRLNTAKQAVKTFDEANPQPLGAEFGNSSPTGMTETFSLKGGLEFTAIYATTPFASAPAAFGIFTNFGEETPGNTPGTLAASIASIPSSSSTDSVGNTGSKIVSMGTPANIVTRNIAVIICLNQGAGSGKKAALIIGAKNRGLFPELAIANADAKVSEVGISGVTQCPA